MMNATTTWPTELTIGRLHHAYGMVLLGWKAALQVRMTKSREIKVEFNPLILLQILDEQGIVSAMEATVECDRARSKHPQPIQTYAQAIGIIQEEIDELALAVRADDDAAGHLELVQIAAMALRAHYDLMPDCSSCKAMEPLARPPHAAVETR